MNLEDYRRGLAEYPPPWEHYLVAENVSAVQAANGRLVGGSMIFGGTRAETEMHALIVAAVNYVTGNGLSSCSYTDGEKVIKELEKALDGLLAAMNNMESWEGMSDDDVAKVEAVEKMRE